jgi:hypothetical protein
MVFVCWRALAENPWASVPFAAARSALDAPAAPLDVEGPGPFAFADASRVRRLLEGAGFEAVRLDPFDHEVVLGEGLDEAVAFSFTGGPAARLCAGIDEAARARVAAAMREALAPYARGERLPLGAAVWIVEARRGA